MCELKIFIRRKLKTPLWLTLTIGVPKGIDLLWG